MIEHVINSAVLYRDKRMEGGCAEHLYRVFHLNMICILPSIRWPPKVDFQVLKKVAAHSGGLENWVLLMYFHESNIGWPRPDVDSEKLSGDFLGLKYLCSLIDLSSFNGLQSLFSSKIFLILMISSTLAPKRPLLVPYCGLDHQKSKSLLIFGNLSFRSCWGQPMLLFWK